MKIAVIGAAGKSGRAFVNAALDVGHEVRAGVRSTSAHFEKSDHLTVVHCDALEPADVDALVAGCDAVVSLIGHVKGSPAFLQTTATANILSAMKRHHVRRLVSLTGTGVRQPEDTISPLDWVMNTAIGLIDPARVHDGKAHADVIQESDCDWTIVRVLKLTNGVEMHYALTPHGPVKPFVSRVTVAQALLRVLSDSSHYRAMPVISPRGSS